MGFYEKLTNRSNDIFNIRKLIRNIPKMLYHVAVIQNDLNPVPFSDVPCNIEAVFDRGKDELTAVLLRQYLESVFK